MFKTLVEAPNLAQEGGGTLLKTNNSSTDECPTLKLRTSMLQRGNIDVRLMDKLMCSINLFCTILNHIVIQMELVRTNLSR
jgi:hypothetical protein